VGTEVGIYSGFLMKTFGHGTITVHNPSAHHSGKRHLCLPSVYSTPPLGTESVGLGLSQA
jgi:hypothetical protein